MKTIALGVLLTLTQPAWSNDAQFLIKEMEAVRDSLKLDDPARIDLTVRLADLYFDTSIQEGKAEDIEVAKKNRLKALELYKTSLDAKATGLKKIKIQFQMARLFTKLGEGKMAEPYYLSVLASKETPKKLIEQSALALAEWHEDDARYEPAKKYYDLAISQCDATDSCNYSYYRKAWLLYKDTKLNDAIAAMEKSLWTKDGMIRENSLTDYLLFLSNNDTDGTKELEKIKALSKKAHRPELLRQLVEAFYVAGNRLAGSTLLAELNSQDPNLYYEVRLLEEYYGFRKWDKVEKYLSTVEKRTKLDIPKKPEEAKEVLAILRRFIVQVDAEMVVAKDLNVYLKRSIDTYLNLYPNDELRKKMQAGWLSAEVDNAKKVVKLEKWIKEDVASGVVAGEIRKLRQTRLSLAQGLKQSNVVIEEAKALGEILKGTKEADEFNYVAARELYEQKKYTEALPLFLAVVNHAKETKEVGNWAVLSQNLALDIYNHQKNYDAIISQVMTWKEMTAGMTLSEEMKKESKSIEQIMVQVQFEKAVMMKDTPAALESFTAICLSGQYTEKSCPNAKVLAVKFKDQDKLVKVLEKMGDEQSLVVEYELMGRFADAARLKEKLELGVKPNLESFLKVALLFELEQNIKERDRVLNRLIDALKKEKSIQPELEKAVFLTLDEANLIDERALSIPWSINQKIKVASRLTIVKPSAASQKILLSSHEANGPLWSKAVLATLEDEFNKTNKIKFYGTQSQRLFKLRTNSLTKFAALAKPMLDGADIETRSYILHMLKMAYKNLANEILNTPIPEGLDEKTVAAVSAQIATIADPFDKVNEDYDRLLTEQINSVTDEALKATISKNLAGAVAGYANFIKGDSKLSAVDSSVALDMKKKLLSEPEDRETLVRLKDFYTKTQNTRLAAYFAGRVDNLKQVE
jgi:tetratricopeptide (TPR) repeat protein